MHAQGFFIVEVRFSIMPVKSALSIQLFACVGLQGSCTMRPPGSDAPVETLEIDHPQYSARCLRYRLPYDWGWGIGVHRQLQSVRANPYSWVVRVS